MTRRPSTMSTATPAARAAASCWAALRCWRGRASRGATKTTSTTEPSATSPRVADVTNRATVATSRAASPLTPAASAWTLSPTAEASELAMLSVSPVGRSLALPRGSSTRDTTAWRTSCSARVAARALTGPAPLPHRDSTT